MYRKYRPSVNPNHNPTRPRVMPSKFNGKCRVCQFPYVIGDNIMWTPGTKGAVHADARTCKQLQATNAIINAQPFVYVGGAGPVQVRSAARAVPSGQMQPIVAFLSAAKANGLKYPKARFLAPGSTTSELRLSLAGSQSKAPGSLQVCLDSVWLGRIEPNGNVVGFKLQNDAAVLKTLQDIATDPSAATKAYGAMMSRCPFCQKPLTDAGSVLYGCGPICAKKFNMPHVAMGTKHLTQHVNAATSVAAAVAIAKSVPTPVPTKVTVSSAAMAGLPADVIAPGFLPTSEPPVATADECKRSHGKFLFKIISVR